MIDIDKWGPPPPITDNVNHGDLLKALNTLGFKIQTDDAVYGTKPYQVLQVVTDKVNNFLPYVKTLIESHTNKVGVSHGETKATTGLADKDNYRMATIDECKNFSNVNAFVHPAGVKATLDSITLDLSGRFQENDLYPIAVISNQLMFKHAPFDSVKRAVVSLGQGTVGIYKDCLLLSPKQNGDINKTFSIFKGFNQSAGVNNRFYDTGGIKNGIVATSENATIFQQIGETAAGATTLPFPLKNATKQLTVQRPATLKSSGRFNGLIGGSLRSPLGNTVNCYFATADKEAYPDNRFAYVHQYTRGVGSAGVESTLAFNPVYTGGGSTIFNNMIANGSPSSGAHFGIDINNICTSNDPDVVLTFEKYIASTCWEVIDKSYIIKLHGVIKHQNNRTNKTLFVHFSCAFRCQITLSPAIDRKLELTPVYFYSPTVLNEANLASFNSGYTRLIEKGSVIDTVTHSGSMIKGGLYVRLLTQMQHSYVHYSRFTDINTVLDYFRTPINALEGVWVNTVPLAHSGLSPMGNTPQRLIPVEYGDDGFKVLSFGLDNSVAGFSWSLLAWNDKTLRPHRASFLTPTKGERIDTSKVVPSSIACFSSSAGVSYHGLNFVSCNRYTGLTGLQFENNAFKFTGEVKLNPANLSGLLNLEDAFIARAKTYYASAGKVDKFLNFEVGVFTLGQTNLTTKNNALVVLSDGFGYLEMAIANYTLTAGTYSVTTPIESLNFSVIVPVSKPTRFIGEIEKEDTYKIASTFSDMSVYAYDGGELVLSFNRPWGDHRIGKATVHIQNYNAAALTMNCTRTFVAPVKLVGGETPTGVLLTEAQLNDVYQPAWTEFPIVNSAAFEAFDIAIPNKGMYCNRWTTMGGIGLKRHFVVSADKAENESVDFDYIQPGDIVVPSGYPVVLAGRAMKTNRDTSRSALSNSSWFKYYLKRDGFNLNVEFATTEWEPRSDYIEIANYNTSLAGYTLTENELTINGLKLSYERKGSCFPISQFYDAAGNQLYGFFYYNDSPHYPPKFEVDLPTTKSVYATQNGAYSVDIYSRVPPIVVDWYVQKPGNAAVKITDKVATTALGNHVYRSQINYSFEHWDLTNSKIWCEAFDERPESTLSTVCNVTVTIPIFSFVTQLPSTKNFAYAGSGTYEVAVNAQAGVKTYQWYHQLAGGNPVLVGGNSPTMTLTNQRTPQHGSKVWCVITDNANQVITSNQCVNTVAQPIFNFTTNLQPTSTVDYNGSITYNVVAESQAGIATYTWFQRVGSQTNQIGGNTNSVTLLNQNSMFNGSTIWCVVKDNSGQEITSVVCTQTVRMPNLSFVTNNVTTKKVMEGGTTQLSVVVNAEVGVSQYQWYLRKGGTTTPIGGNDRVLTILSADYAWNTGKLFVVVTDNVGQQITSVSCVLTVIKAVLAFTVQPANTTVAWDGTANFSTTVTSNIGSLVYVWKLDGAVVGGNSNTLSLPNRRTNGTVVVEVTDGFGNKITSNPATITVNAAALSFVTDIPATKTLGYYEDATFTVAVNAQAGVASYTWYRKRGLNTDVVGTGATLTLADQTQFNTGNKVWCVVADNAGQSITSTVCTLTVNTPYIVTDLTSPLYHYVTTTPKRFTVTVEAYDGTPTFRWFNIPAGESVGVEITGGITVIGETSHLDYVMNVVSEGTKRIYCEVTFNDGTKLTSTTSVVYVGSPLTFATNLPANGGNVIPGTTLSYEVAVIGGFGNRTYKWFVTYTDFGGSPTTTPHITTDRFFTIDTTGKGSGDMYEVWCEVTDTTMNDTITSVHSVTQLISPIEMTYPLQGWMWGNSNGPTTVFVAVKDVNGPYTFDWTVESDLWEYVSSNRNASFINFGKDDLNRNHTLKLRVTDASGNFKDFSSQIATTAFNNAGKFDPMPPKAIPIHQDVNGVPVTIQTAGTVTPLRFQYFNLNNGTNFASDVNTTYNTQIFHHEGDGVNKRLVVEVGATNKGIIPSHEFVLVGVPTRVAGYGLAAPTINTDSTSISAAIPSNIGRFPHSIFLYGIDTSVAPQFRKAIELGKAIGVDSPGDAIIATVPAEYAGKDIEVYSASIDADGHWFVSGVKTFSIPASINSWQDNHLGITYGQASDFTFNFKADGTWTFSGNGPESNSGQWLAQLPGDGANYSIRIVNTIGGTYSSTNITSAFQKLNVTRYIRMTSGYPPVGEPDSVRVWQGTIEIRNDATGLIHSSGKILVEAMAIRT